MVLEVCKEIPAWPGRHLFEDGEQRRYFGLKTEGRGVVEFECKNARDYETWTQGVFRLLSIVSGLCFALFAFPCTDILAILCPLSYQQLCGNGNCSAWFHLCRGNLLQKITSHAKVHNAHVMTRVSSNIYEVRGRSHLNKEIQTPRWIHIWSLHKNMQNLINEAVSPMISSQRLRVESAGTRVNWINK